MLKLIKSTAIALLLMFGAFPALGQKNDQPTKSKWRVSGSIDEISQTYSGYAVSDDSSPTRKMRFPYEDTKAFFGGGQRKGGTVGVY